MQNDKFLRNCVLKLIITTSNYTVVILRSEELLFARYVPFRNLVAE